MERFFRERQLAPPIFRENRAKALPGKLGHVGADWSLFRAYRAPFVPLSGRIPKGPKIEILQHLPPGLKFSHYVPRLTPNLTSNQRVRVWVRVRVRVWLHEAGSMERGGGGQWGEKGEVAKKGGKGDEGGKMGGVRVRVRVFLLGGGGFGFGQGSLWIFKVSAAWIHLSLKRDWCFQARLNIPSEIVFIQNSGP